MNDRPLRFFLGAFILLSLLSVGPVMAQPDPPGNLQAESLANGQIELSWDAVTGATSYEIYKSTTDSIPSSYLKVVTSTSTVLTIGTDGLVNGINWFFWVKAVDGTGTSNPAGSVTAVCDASAPLAVTLVSPVNGSYVVVNPPTLDWNATTDDSSAGNGSNTGVSHYELQYSTSADFLPSYTYTVSNITQTEYTISNELPNNTYYWRVRAYDNAGNALAWTSAGISEYSFIVNMEAPTQTAPANGSSFNGDPADELPPTFAWTQVDGANGYLLEIDDQTPISSSPEYSFVVSGGTTTSYEPLVVFDDGTYY